ncbi:MAG: hypothetical protein AAGC56_12345 [Pseudomonadota bacterium]
MIAFLIFAGGAVALAWAAYAAWARRIETEIREGAALEFERLTKVEPALVAGVDAEVFAAVYRRVHFPRFPKYALGAASAFVAALPVILALTASVVIAGQAAGVLPETDEIARFVPEGTTAATPDGMCDTECQLVVAANFAGFYFFFGVLAAWLAIVAVAMYRFHARRPGDLREELIRARP